MTTIQPIKHPRSYDVVKPKITPSRTVLAGWNGTVKGLEALAESLERGKVK